MQTAINLTGATAVRVINLERDQKRIEVAKNPAAASKGPLKNDQKVVLMLGSTDDARNLAIDVPKPEKVIPVSDFEVLKKSAAFGAWVDNQQIAVYPVL